MSAGVLVPLWRRGEPVTALLDDSGDRLVLVTWPTVDALVDSLFHTVRTYALDQPAVLAASLRLVGGSTRQVREPATRVWPRTKPG